MRRKRNVGISVVCVDRSIIDAEHIYKYVKKRNACTRLRLLDKISAWQSKFHVLLKSTKHQRNNTGILDHWKTSQRLVECLSRVLLLPEFQLRTLWNGEEGYDHPSPRGRCSSDSILEYWVYAAVRIHQHPLDAVHPIARPSAYPLPHCPDRRGWYLEEWVYGNTLHCYTPIAPS